MVKRLLCQNGKKRVQRQALMRHGIKPVLLKSLSSKFIMQILVEVPSHLPDAAQCSPQQFMQDAKLAMAIKLFEMKRLSSGFLPRLLALRGYSFSVSFTDLECQ